MGLLAVGSLGGSSICVKRLACGKTEQSSGRSRIAADVGYDTVSRTAHPPIANCTGHVLVAKPVFLVPE